MLNLEKIFCSCSRRINSEYFIVTRTSLSESLFEKRVNFSVRSRFNEPLSLECRNFRIQKDHRRSDWLSRTYERVFEAERQVFDFTTRTQAGHIHRINLKSIVTVLTNRQSYLTNTTARFSKETRNTTDMKNSSSIRAKTVSDFSQQVPV